MGTLGTAVASTTASTSRWLRAAIRRGRGSTTARMRPPSPGLATAEPAPPILPDGAVVVDAPPASGAGAPELAPDARGAVIIPAHNESAVIGRTLEALAPLAALDGVEVIVACNGCSDATADIARGYPGVRVAETAQASKPAALNLGDRAATAWPRLYLDADIEVPPAAILAVFDTLRGGGVLAARPRYVYDVAGAAAPVRSYYRARSRIPAPPTRLWGAGGYAASEEGHRRIGDFPPVTADDSWFDEQFTADEKRVVVTAPMRVRTARDTAGLLAVLARQRRGYREIGIASATASRGSALLGTIRGPRTAWDAAWYVALTVVSRRRARRAARLRGPGWERDGSTRSGAEAAR